MTGEFSNRIEGQLHLESSGVAQQQSLCLACARPRAQSLAPPFPKVSVFTPPSVWWEMSPFLGPQSGNTPLLNWCSPLLCLLFPKIFFLVISLYLYRLLFWLLDYVFVWFALWSREPDKPTGTGQACKVAILRGSVGTLPPTQKSSDSCELHSLSRFIALTFCCSSLCSLKFAFK